MAWLAVAAATLGVAHAATARPPWTVLACLDARGGLSPAADGYQRRLAAACHESALPLAVLRLDDGAAGTDQLATRLLLLDKRSWREYERGTAPSRAEAIGRAVEAAFSRQPGEHTLVVLVAHGTGLLEADGPRGMDAAQLGEALSRTAPLDLLGLDTCYGGSLEKLWALRECAHYVTAAPGLVCSPGLQWDEALRRRGQGSARELAGEVCALGMADGSEPAALVSLDMAQGPRLVAAVRELGAALTGCMAQQGHLLTYARSRARSWGRRQELCDLGELADGLRRNAPAGAMQAAAQELQEALRAATVASWFSGQAEGTGPGGLGVYFPRSVEETPATYQHLQFAADSGWYDVLEAYWNWVLSLLSGTMNPRGTE